MNLPQEVALSSLRFTFGNENTENDIDFVVDILSQAVEHMRKTVESNNNSFANNFTK